MTAQRHEAQDRRREFWTARHRGTVPVTMITSRRYSDQRMGMDEAGSEGSAALRRVLHATLHVVGLSLDVN